VLGSGAGQGLGALAQAQQLVDIGVVVGVRGARADQGGQGQQAQGLQAITINGNQDFLVQVVSTAPEPGTWFMMLGGFGLIGGMMRRRARRDLAPQIA